MPYQANISQVVETDVLVVGGGSAGATAAIAAARQGAKTLLVERYGFLGGISTQVLDTFYGFYTPGTQTRKVIGGIPDDIVAALADQGKVIYRPNTYGAGQGITYDPQALKIIWERLAQQAGVRLLYHSFVMDVVTIGERITGVIAATKAGLLQINAKTIIDASGDADVAAAAGVPFEFAGEQVQSLTTTFHLINVDVERAAKVSKNDLHERMAQAIGSGRYDLPRREGSVHINPLPGVMVTNMTRVGNIDATDPFQLTQAEIEGRRQAEEYARFLVDWVPGYEHADMGALSHQIGVRESRRIFGDYRLTKADVLTGRKFEDAIAQCGAPIEDHHSGSDTKWQYLPDGATYDIPFRALLPQKVDGLLVVGRCLSADHDAHASVRSMGQCMAMGQAAGTAAALSLETHSLPREVNISDLQTRLRDLGAILD